MTETCAGCIYNTNCPTYDRGQNSQHVTVGKGISGLQLRVRLSDGKSPSAFADAGQSGHLELCGDVVFDGYFNDRDSTAAAFTDDGWFITGDLACVNHDGQLVLQGRSKDTININGVKYAPDELEHHLEKELIQEAVPGSFCCFSTLPQSSDTEKVVVAYSPSVEENDTRARIKTHNRIVDIIGFHTSSSAIVLPLTAIDLKPSALGNLPRGAIKSAFEKGAYTLHLRKASEANRVEHDVAEVTVSPLEALIRHEIQEYFQFKGLSLSLERSVFLLGATSMDLIKIVRLISDRLQLRERLTLSQVLRNSTPRRLALVIEGSEGKDGVGSPVVTLRSEGRKTPLWLVHPGVGEILVFMNLVKLIDDRPVYAFRAEGLDSGVSPFASLDALLDYYLKHLKAVQGEGPYAIAGYSFGSMIAFELCKRLEAGGDEVLYCGCWNLPPHIKHRMRQLGWVECLANLFHFTKLMGQDQAIHQICILRTFSKQEAVAHLRALSDSDRWLELGLGEEELVKWTDLASSLQYLARDYEPRGTIRSMDVFVADPLKEVAVDRDDWVQNKLSRWREFVSDVQFYDVPGEHYSMLDKINVSRFADKLKEVLKAREGLLRRGI
ncbi:AMP-dependent synthetase/ligase [Colletotrichum scovillei]|uniref:AMP-dependent synthetase/ligase n=1 Tax=Colletotrichum scovillei TaxID=1209932 RepID=UPI0015C33A5C|nr:AMP-dependent synthetase/ligase [Colletotrichum scovillei]KAF4773662.1 AMP-dependent synthetase/ligase [Colletotrichum scovillei]